MAGDAGGFPLVARRRGDVKLAAAAAAALLCPFLLPLDSVFYLLASRSSAAPRASLRIPLCAPFFSPALRSAGPIHPASRAARPSACLLVVSARGDDGTQPPVRRLLLRTAADNFVRGVFFFVVVLCPRRASVISGSFSSAWWAMTTRGRRTIPMCVN